MVKKIKRKSKENTVARWVIFFFLVGITAASIYLLKNPELATKPIPTKATHPSRLLKKKPVSVKLYFADTQSDYLIPEPRRVIFQEGAVKDNIKKIIEELIKGPKSNLIQTMPPGVVLRAVKLKGNALGVLDFSPELSRNHPGGSLAEMQTIYSVVNSIALNISSLKEIQILVDGRSLETLKGHIDIRAPLKPNPSIIKKG